MFKQVFESKPLPYRLPTERYRADGSVVGIPSGVGMNGLYHAELVTAPRIYSETVNSGNEIDGMYVSRFDTANSQSVITLVGWTYMIYWPGYERLYWRFDSTTGEFLERGPNPGTYYEYELYQSRDGSIWQTTITGEFYQKDPVTLAKIDGTTREPDEFGVTIVYIPLVDRLQNLLIAYTSDDAGKNTISVFDWTTGDKLRTIFVSGAATNLMPEDGHRCWVVTDQGMLNLVDYISGEVVTTLKTPLPVANDISYSFDPTTRRMLAFDVVPDAENGAGLSVITGYYPIPQPVAITAPIPIRAMRAGRTSKVLCRTFGDAGEGLGSGKLSVELDGDAELVANVNNPDSSGYTLFQVRGTDAGTVSIEVTLETT